MKYGDRYSGQEFSDGIRGGQGREDYEIQEQGETCGWIGWVFAIMFVLFLFGGAIVRSLGLL